MNRIILIIMATILLLVLFVALSDWLVVRQFKGTLAGILAPGYSECGRCNMPWKFTNGHGTDYTESRGCFPLCKRCWGELTIQERLPYYKQLWIDWQEWGNKDIDVWYKMEAAVLAGK